MVKDVLKLCMSKLYSLMGILNHVKSKWCWSHILHVCRCGIVTVPFGFDSAVYTHLTLTVMTRSLILVHNEIPPPIMMHNRIGCRICRAVRVNSCLCVCGCYTEQKKKGILNLVLNYAFLARLHFSAEELLLYPRRRRRRRRQRPRRRRRPHAKC